MRKIFVQGVILGIVFLLHFTTLSFIGSRFNSYCFAETNVGGPIRGSAIWTLDKSPYIVKSSVSVVADATLTIEPGVEVKIQGSKAIQIDGTLIARGTADAKITFTPYQKEPLARWGYILFTDSSVDARLDKEKYSGGSILEYCVVEYTNGGDREGAVVCDKASPFINYCEIRNNTSSGIRANNSPLTISSSTIINNNSVSSDHSHSGGGIYASDNSPLTISFSTITNNSASNCYHAGGGICVINSPLTISSSTIANNSASGDYSGNSGTSAGGGIRAINSPLTISSSTIANNSASSGSSSGGGIYASDNSPLTIFSSTIANNSASSGYYFYASSGGIYICGILTITSSTITRNKCNFNGGGIYFSGNSANISSCIIDNNSAAKAGGGIYSSSGNLLITSSTISNNSGPEGGGIWSSSSTISHCNICNNTASGNGGGISIGNGEASHNLFINNSAQGHGASLYYFASSSSSSLSERAVSCKYNV
jgi:hypothetical protein